MPRGRGRMQIVPNHEVLQVNAIETEGLTVADIYALADNDVIPWLARRRLIRNNHIHPICNQPCSLVRKAGGSDNFRWQ